MLTAVPDDTKALFRRCQANKELGKLEDALMDAKRLLSIEPTNKPGIELMQQLTRVIQDKVSYSFLHLDGLSPN